MPRQDTHPHNCDTCKNIDCEFWEEKPHMSAGHDEQTGWRASPGVVTFAVGCASHSKPVPEQCPHWKSSSSLKSDCRDQGIGSFYCALPMAEHDAQVAKDEREQLVGKIFEYMSSNGVEKRPEGYYVVSGTFSLGGFVKYLESLRQQEEQR